MDPCAQPWTRPTYQLELADSDIPYEAMRSERASTLPALQVNGPSVPSPSSSDRPLSPIHGVETQACASAPIAQAGAGATLHSGLSTLETEAHHGPCIEHRDLRTYRRTVKNVRLPGNSRRSGGDPPGPRPRRPHHPSVRDVPSHVRKLKPSSSVVGARTSVLAAYASWRALVGGGARAPRAPRGSGVCSGGWVTRAGGQGGG